MFRIRSSLAIVMSLGCGSATTPDVAAQFSLGVTSGLEEL